MANFVNTLEEPKEKPVFKNTLETQKPVFKNTLQETKKDEKVSFGLVSLVDPAAAVSAKPFTNIEAGKSGAESILRQTAASLMEGTIETIDFFDDVLIRVEDGSIFDRVTNSLLSPIPLIPINEGKAIAGDVLKLLPKAQREKFLKKQAEVTKLRGKIKEKSRKFIDENIAGKPQTLTEGLFRTAPKVIVSFVGWNKFLRANKIISKSSKFLPRVIRRYGAAALMDMSVFDPNEARFSNFLEDNGLGLGFTKYLMAKPEDSKAKGRFKQAVEGVIFGGFVNKIVDAGVWIKSVHQLKKDLGQAAKEVLSDNTIIKSVDIDAASRGTIPATKGRPEKILVDTEIAAAKAEVPRQIAKDSGETVPMFTKQVSVEATEIAIEASKHALEGSIKKADKVSRELAKALSLGEIRFKDLPRLLKTYNLTKEEFAQTLVNTASFAGRILNRYSQIVAQAGRSLTPEGRAILEAAAKQGREFTGMDAVLFSIKQIENFRRATLVTQLTTAVRNVAVQGPRMVLSIFDEALQTTLMGIAKPQDFMKMVRGDLNALNAAVGPIKRGRARVLNIVDKTKKTVKAAKQTAREIVKAESIFKEGGKKGASVEEAFGRGKKRTINVLTGKPMVTTKFDEILGEDQFALQTTRLLNQPVHEVMSEGKGVTWYLNVFNRTQETFFRKIAFEAMLRKELKIRGLDFDTIKPKAIPEDVFKTSVDYALEMTFARSARGQFAQKFIDGWSNLILPTTINPFPRFAFANALPFMWDHSPLGLFSAALKSDWTTAVAKKTSFEILENASKGSSRDVARSLSRAGLGTLMFMSAWHLRQSEHAGNKPEEIEWDGADGRRVTWDASSSAPILAPFLFGAAFIQDRIALASGQYDRPRITNDMIAKNIIGLNRISGTGLSFVDLFRADDERTSERLLTHFAGQYIGSFGVPIKTVKDIVAQFGTEEAILRNTRESGLFGPLMNSIPFLSQQLPPATSPFKEGIDIETGNLTPIRIDENTLIMMGFEGGPRINQPLGRQIFGLTLRIKNPIEREVDRLRIKRGRFFPKTGNEKANRLIAGYMGYLSERLIIPLVQSEAYQNIQGSPDGKISADQLKKGYIENLYFARGEGIKAQAAGMLFAHHRNLAIRLKLDKNKEPILKEAIDQLKKRFEEDSILEK